MTKDILYENDSFLVIKPSKTQSLFIEKKDACLVIVTKGKSILLIEVERNLYEDETSFEIPGGRIENGESPIQAAQRELLEETGVVTDKLKKVFSTFPIPSLVSEEVHVFHCELPKNAQFSLPISAQSEGITSAQFVCTSTLRSLLYENKVLSAPDALAMMYFLNFLSDDP